MVAPVPDWASIDESLRDDIPKLRLGGRKPFARLNSTLDTMLEIKAVATKKQIQVPEVPEFVALLELYMDTIAQGRHLQGQSWWKSIRGMRDWHGSKDEFKLNCDRVFNMSHQTSCMINARAPVHVDNSAAVPQGSIRRRRSLDGLVQAEPNLDLIQPQNPFDDTPMRSTPPDAGLVAQSSSQNCINANTLQEETIRNIVEMSSAKTLEQFILHGRLPQTVNHFTGCIVRPGGGTGYTLNVGGKNNKGAGKYISKRKFAQGIL